MAAVDSDSGLVSLDLEGLKQTGTKQLRATFKLGPTLARLLRAFSLTDGTF
jgi:hypothetical protein